MYHVSDPGPSKNPRGNRRLIGDHVLYRPFCWMMTEQVDYIYDTVWELKNFPEVKVVTVTLSSNHRPTITWWCPLYSNDSVNFSPRFPYQKFNGASGATTSAVARKYKLNRKKFKIYYCRNNLAQSTEEENNAVAQVHYLNYVVFLYLCLWNSKIWKE